MEKVSVIIALYNCEPYLKRCLDSVVLQTYSNWEIIISDDCSTDNSLEIAKSYAKIDPRIKVIAQPKNIGILKQYNFLFEQATGDYIAIQDADDWSSLDRLEKQLDVLREHKDVLICGTACTFHYPGDKKVDCLKEKDIKLKGATSDFYFAPATIMMRKSVLEMIPGMNEWFEGGSSMDRYFIIEILEKGYAYFLNESLYQVGVRINSNHKKFSEKKLITTAMCDKLIAQRISTGSDWLLEKDFESIKKQEKEILKNKKLIAEIYRESAVFDIELNNFSSAQKNLKFSVLHHVNSLNLRTSFFFLRRLLQVTLHKGLA